MQRNLIGFYNTDGVCLLLGVKWVFKQNSLRFVFKGLNVLLTLHVKLINIIILLL
jgi:hypothetical protein